MMKKTTIFLLYFLLIFSFISCSNETITTNKTTQLSSTVTKEITTTTTELVTTFKEYSNLEQNSNVIYTILESNNWLEAKLTNDLWSYITLDNEIVFPFIFDQINPFNNGLAIIKINNYYGVINYLGNFIIQPRYLNVERINNSDYFKAYNNDNLDIIDCDGKVLFTLPNDFDIVDYNLGYFIEKENNLAILVDIDNNVIIDDYDEIIFTYYNDLLIVKKANLYGIINYNNEIIIPINYVDIFINEIGDIALRDNLNNNYLVDKQGNILLQKESEWPFRFNEFGISGYKKDGKIGLINKQGSVVVEPIYHFTWNDTQENIFSVVLRDGYNNKVILDETGKIKYTVLAFDISNFNDEFIELTNLDNGQISVINYDQIFIVGPRFKHFSFYSDLYGNSLIFEDKTISTLTTYNVYDSLGNLITNNVHNLISFNVEKQVIVTGINDLVVSDFSGNTILSVENAKDYKLYNDYILVTINHYNDNGIYDYDLFGVYDYNGNLLIPFNYLDILGLK